MVSPFQPNILMMCRRIPEPRSWLGWFLAVFLFGLYCKEVGRREVYNDVRRAKVGQEQGTPPSSDANKHNGIMSEGVSANTDYVERNLATLDQADVRLVNYVRNRYLSPPSNKPYNLKAERRRSTPLTTWITAFFRNKTKGVFVEGGASDGGIRSSVTLELEQRKGWTGLLIECNPMVHPLLRQTHRKAWVAAVCISNNQFPKTINFSYPPSWTYSGRMGKPWKIHGKSTNWTSLEVDAIPLYTLLAAAGIHKIDLFVFDVEGIEPKVLKHFPFHLVTIKVILMEVFFLTESERKELIRFMESRGYALKTKFKIDYAFVLNKG